MLGDFKGLGFLNKALATVTSPDRWVVRANTSICVPKYLYDTVVAGLGCGC